ncbi:unnamed protein product, partial [Discosporangium mesarthrocarpum]
MASSSAPPTSKGIETLTSDEHEASSASLTDITEQMAKVESKLLAVEAALAGQGTYLGISDKPSLIRQLEALQKKEEMLRKKELILLEGGMPPAEMHLPVHLAGSAASLPLSPNLLNQHSLTMAMEGIGV